jgi:peroxin-3
MRLLPAITRAFTLLYTLGLLTMLTRVQLNLLGRRSYLSSVVTLATGTAQSTISLENNDDDGVVVDDPEQAYGSDFDTNRKYLTFSWWLLNRGWIDIMHVVEEAVRDVFGHLSPRDLLSFDTFSQLTLEVRKKVEGPAASSENDGRRSSSKWLRFLLPPTTLETFVLKESGVLGDSATAETATDDPAAASTTAAGQPLRRLVDETSDLIDSPAFSHVLTQLLDAGFNLLLSRKILQGAFDLSATTIPETEDEGEPASKVVLLPKILSVLTRQAHVIGNGMPNEYLQAMEAVRELEAFAAVVYSSNWENEMLPEDASAAPDAAKSQPTTQGGESVRPSQVSTLGDESIVVVDNEPSQISFESAWEKASGQK